MCEEMKSKPFVVKKIMKQFMLTLNQKVTHFFTITNLALFPKRLDTSYL